ncbi:MAG TPA: hypothetical protein VLD65_08890 [Anaerolineales bacterium]|nr:hypothetical protein [Anaerolineales bacterium]
MIYRSLERLLYLTHAVRLWMIEHRWEVEAEVRGTTQRFIHAHINNCYPVPMNKPVVSLISILG